MSYLWRITRSAVRLDLVIAIGERLGGMWSVSRPKLGHPVRRDWGQGELAESPHTPNVTVALFQSCIIVHLVGFLLPVCSRLPYWMYLHLEQFISKVFREFAWEARRCLYLRNVYLRHIECDRTNLARHEVGMRIIIALKCWACDNELFKFEWNIVQVYTLEAVHFYFQFTLGRDLMRERTRSRIQYGGR